MPGGEEMSEGHLASLPDGWERSETVNGIPYYRNHGDGSTQWEHPEITKVFRDIDDLNCIKYAAYRTAMKLRALQKITHLHVVSRHVMEEAFTELGLDQGQNSGVLTAAEAESVLNKMFQLSHRDGDKFTKPELCTELTLNWILKCFDSGRTGYVKIRSVKVGLMAMSTATLEEKYQFMFHQVINGHVGLSHSSLTTLIKDLLLLPQHVSEGGTFGPDTIAATVQNCWSTVGNEPTALLNEDEFLEWVQREPVCVVWLPTLHRLATAETVKHEAKCSACKAFPIVGFRYRCLKCTNMDLCQNCFWTQRTARNHKVAHPMKEYCLATTSGDDVRDFAKQMKNKITRKYRRKPPKKSYLDYPTTREGGGGGDLPDQSPVFADVHTRVNILASRLHELEGLPEGVVQPRPAPITTPVEHHARPSAGPRSSEEQQLLEGQVEALMGRNQQLEAQVQTLAELQGCNQELEAEVETLRELLKQKPKELPPRVIRIPVAVPTTPVTPVASDVQGKRVPSPPLSVETPSRGPQEWSYLFGGEEQEMEAMVEALLTAFPTPTTEPVATELGSELFMAAAAVGHTLSSMVEQVASTQDF